MKALFKKINKGNYPNIPKVFSKDLGKVISKMLATDPKLRPSCTEILSMSEAALSKPKKTKRSSSKSKSISKSGMVNELMKTIRVPK